MENATNNKIEIYSLCSGSSGNCYYFNCGGDEFLIDIGMSMKGVKSALSSLGSSLENIRAIFITHEHSDHTKGCAMVSKYYKIPIHVLSPCASLIDADKSLINAHPHFFSVKIGNTEIFSIPTSHDSAACCGYKVCRDGLSFGIATDMGFANSEIATALTGTKAAVIEANYDPDMLKYGPYPYHLKERIASKAGHLSNEESARLCAYLSEKGTEHIMLGHLSKENNTPEKALLAVEKRIALCEKRAKISVAKRSDITLLYNGTLI